MGCELDFETGRPRPVGDGAKEYRLLRWMLAVSSLPWLVLAWFHLTLALSLIGFVATFKVLTTFWASTHTRTSHHLRFLLAGNNPIGMTGASSLLLGGVDALLDWREDSDSRRRSPLQFYALTALKILLTPIGLVVAAAEFGWDVLLLRRDVRLCRYKYEEFFRLAQLHSQICPEKSNDIFYADLAWARYQDDPVLYQWTRLRAMVFELQHYRLDAEQGLGVAATNVFWQSEQEAYRTLRQLQLEPIEQAVAAYYRSNIQRFPLPARLARRLIDNARPLWHYQRMRTELARQTTPDTAPHGGEDQELAELERLRAAWNSRLRDAWVSSAADKSGEPDRAGSNQSAPQLTSNWMCLRVLDAERDAESDYISWDLRRCLLAAGLWMRTPGGVRLADEYQRQAHAWLKA